MDFDGLRTVDPIRKSNSAVHVDRADRNKLLREAVDALLVDSDAEYAVVETGDTMALVFRHAEGIEVYDLRVRRMGLYAEE